MRAIRTVSLLALAVAAGWAPQAVAQGRSGIEQIPLPPPPGTTAPQRPPPGSARPPGTGVPPAVPLAPAPVAPGVAQPPGSDEGSDVMVVPPPAQKIVNAVAVFAGLDKITGRTTTFDVPIGETAQFGALQVTPRACYTRPPTETQNTTSFAEVNEVTLQGQAKRIFTGWMFASSPGLHAVEHPIYDVWLIGCKASAPVTARPAGQ